MKHFRRTLSLVSLVLCLATPALAQATRTWVAGSSFGDDANPCSRDAPCKTFAGAYSKTAASGEIDAIEAGGFGAVTIGKSLTIDGYGTMASILGSGTNGVNINGAGIVVTLRNLDISAPDNGLIGINILAAAKVTIENCRIYGFNSGIFTNLGGSTALIQITNSTINNNDNGILAGNGARIVINNSILTGNTTAAISVAGTAKVLSSNTSLSMGGVGVYVNGASPLVLLTHNDIYFNTAPFQLVGGGILYSYVDNRITGTGLGGSLTPAPNPVPFP